MTGIDLFAGCGGSTEGARKAGVKIVWAANHSQRAVEFHKANHRQAEHVCQDLQQFDFSLVPDHDATLASPDCRGHTKARGKELPRHDVYRSTAWAVVSCLEAKRPAAGVIENVPEFLLWSLYPSWKDALNRLGYAVSPHVIDAADHGVPQHRVRVLIVCTRSKTPLQLKLQKQPHISASSFVDFKAGEWFPWRGLCESRKSQIKQGRKEFGTRFLIPYYSSGSGLSGRSLSRPIGTITTRDRYRIIDGPRSRMLSVEECRAAMGFPDTYILPRQKQLAKHFLGQAVCPPVMAAVLKSLKESI